MKNKLCELRKDVTVMENFQIKPNYSFLARKHHMDPRTVKKYYEGYEGKSTNRNKPSKLDEYYDLIKEKLSLPGCKISSIFFFLTHERDYKGSYSNLTYFIRNNPELREVRSKKGVHVRYETEIGEVLQFDWVEEITMINKYGEEFIFNVFSAELCYSRFHYFGYSKHKTREDVYIQLINTFKFIGGIPKSVLTDNMSSIVDTNKSEFNKEFKAFSKDMGINISKCKVRHPFTKGKVEVRNKFIKWLIPYNYEFENEDDLKTIINKITIEVNNKINDTTNMKPILLYQNEKEYLEPLPSNQVLQYYLNLSISVTVDNASLINYKGNKYSVPTKFINKTLKVKEVDNKLYVYHNTDLIATHDICSQKINYRKEDYIAGLKESMPNKDNTFIENLAKRNLNLFDEISKIERKD